MLDSPWLCVRFDRPLNCLSWAPYRPGFVRATEVLWREVRDADLPPDFDAVEWLASQVTARGGSESIAMLTSRNLAEFRLEQANSSLLRTTCCATVGLSNAERVGTRQLIPPIKAGTINLLVATERPLAPPALIEALSIATQARTAAVMDHGPDLPDGRATGTGTDCIVVAAPPGDTIYAGLHTDVGEAVGQAVYRTVAGGVRDWMETFRPA